MMGKANSMTGRSRLQNRVELLGTCAMIAVSISLAKGSESFAANATFAFQGTPTVESGDALISRGSGSGGFSAIDTISLNTQSAIINWTTFDQSTNTPIDFLPQNTAARFQSSNQNFTVLNRVFAATPGQAISINGTVESLDFSSQTTGSVWFYSPGGIIAGPTSVFNVGNLILTADDIDTTGGLFGANNTIRFRGGAGSTSAVTIQPGAQINLNAAGSYLALVAPQVTMGGAATINGSAAYIAAEQVDVRINGGAFDIAFVTGTGVADALTHTGSTTGPAAANGRIVLAAMPKNTAITMLVGGTLGYTPAATASVQNGTVVLASGYNVGAGDAISTPSNLSGGNIVIGNASFTSSVFGSATSNLTAGPTSSGTLSFSSNATLAAQALVSIGADSGETVTVGGNLSLSTTSPEGTGTARLFSTVTPSSLLAAPSVNVAGTTTVQADLRGLTSESGQSVTAGTAQVVVTGGNMTFGNGLNISAQGLGGEAGTGPGGNGTGGTASLAINGGTVTVTNGLTVRADGTGAGGPTTTGNGVGGNASVTLAAGALNLNGIGHQITANGNVTGQFSPVNGGNATGGTAQLLVTGGSAALGDLSVLADADGGFGSTQSGNGTGGTARVVAQTTGANAFFSATGLTVSASGTGGGPGQSLNQRGGNGVGGLASFTVSGNGATTGLATIRARGSGGPGDILGGNASGGTARLSVTGSSLTASFVTVDAEVQAGGTNSFGTSGSTNATGLAEIVTNNAALTADGIDVRASSSPSRSAPGISSSPATPGASRAGVARLSFTDSAVSTRSGRTTVAAQTQSDYVSGSATIAAGGIAELVMSGGTFQTAQLDMSTLALRNASVGGNTILTLTNDATLTTPLASLAAWAGASSDANPAPARGGDIDVTLTDSTISGSIAADANGDGGYNSAGTTGGRGTGGTIDLLMQGNSSVTSLNLIADGGTPGEPRGAFSNGPAPVGFGGRITAILSGGTVNGDVLLSASGLGRDGSNGTGGNATLTLSGATVSGGLVQVSATGTGAAGIAGDAEQSILSTRGGNGIGGTALVDFITGTISSSTVTIDASGIGGDGGDGSSVDAADGGLGRGGSATFRSAAASVLDSGASPTVRASGQGGQGGRATYSLGPTNVSFVGGNGGNGFGGTASVDWAGTAITPGSLVADASSTGGDGGRAYDNAPAFTGDTGGQGGDALGGTATIRISGPSTQFVNVAANADAVGGDGGDGNSTLRGGDATGGTAEVRVADAALVVGVLNISTAAESGLNETGSFTAGARGSDATGGTSLFEVSGTTGSYIASAGGQYAYGGIPIFSMAADAYASDGISGRNGTTGGAGGRGGNAAGGQVTVRALDGLINLGGNTLAGFYITASGGNAGNGGNASTYQATGGGRGGDGGTGAGGSATFTANGGQLVLGSLALSSGAMAGSAGSGGYDAGRPAVPGTPAGPGVPATPGTPAIPPAFGGFGTQSFGSGGTITIESLTSSSIGGQDGRIVGGNLTADVSALTEGYGDFGYSGTVSIANLNTGGTALRLGSLTVDAGAATLGFSAGSTTLTAINAPIVVDGNIQVTGPTSAYVVTEGTGAVTAGGDVLFNVQGFVGVDYFGTGSQPALKARSITAAGGAGINTQSALIGSDNDIILSSAFGSITTGALTTGRDVGVTANNGNIFLGPITAGRNATISGSTTSSSVTVGATIVGGFLEARGATLGFGNITAGTDAILSTYNGSLAVGNVTAGDDIFLTVNGSFANPNTVSPDSQTGQTSTTVNTLVAGNLRSTGLGSDTAASGPATFAGAGPTGNVVRVRASGAVQAGSIATAGTAIVASDLASIATGAISAPAGIGLYVRGNATVGDITTTGVFWLGDSSQVFGFVPSYTVINFAPYQTPTRAGATLGAVQAGLIRGSVLTDTVYGSIAATGDLLWSTGNSTTIGGNVTGGALTTGASMTITAGGGVTFTTATSQGPVLLVASTDAVTGAAIIGQSSIDASARTSVTIPVVTTPGAVNLGASSGDVRVVTNLQSTDAIVGAGQSIFARSTGALTATNFVAVTGTIDVAAAGNLDVSQARALGDITLASAGNLTADTVDAGYDAFRQASGFSAAATLTGINVTTGTSIETGRSLTINATNAATINGTALGRFETAINSVDIVIGSGATLGGIGNRLTLTNTSQSQTFIGDLSGTGGWRLDAAEIGRIVAHDVSIFAPVVGGPASTALNSTRAPDVTIGSFTATGGQQLGGESIFGIETAGKVRVTGAMTFTALQGDTTVAIRGDEAIEILDGGRITLNDANGLAGTLELTSRNIIASSSAAPADFAAATSLTAISDRAGRNDGTVNDGGYLQAGTIRATLLNSTLIIQNTGAATSAGNKEFAGRRGFTVGAGGFTVIQGGTNPVRVAINGRQVSTTATATGGFTTGTNLIPLISFVPQSGTPFTFPLNGATSTQIQAAATTFSPLSTVNGCTIISASSCGNAVVVNDPIGVNDPIRDVLAGDFGEKSVTNLLPISIIQLKDYSRAGDEPLIDEPVTGAGNDDLWSVDDSRACDPAKEACK